jgi:hydroxymethylpyrimidine/phosphomethylpyrimidine kinase
VIRNSQKTEKILEELLLQVCSYDRSREPPGITSMHWGVAGCCRDGVPDAVSDQGENGAEGLIRLFAEEPGEVVRRIGTIDRNFSRT